MTVPLPTPFREQFWGSRGLVRACVMDGFTDGREDMRGTVCSLSALPPGSLWRRDSRVARTGRTRLGVCLLLREGWVSIYWHSYSSPGPTWGWDAGLWWEPLNLAWRPGRTWSEEPLAWLQGGRIGGRAGSRQCAKGGLGVCKVRFWGQATLSSSQNDSGHRQGRAGDQSLHRCLFLTRCS